MKVDQVRAIFTSYFESKGHRLVPSSSLVPAGDPSLLFTNAGMVQFKDVFLAKKQLDFDRAVSSQRCLRAGGKHNDLDNVGFTARHHTFFEMLGNFSFGSYFKKDAILMAWELITEHYQLPVDKLCVTVYMKDNESYDIWLKEVGLPSEKIIRIDSVDNFWSMGDTGPCGPCTEIFFDHGPSVEGGLPGTDNEDGDRYMEIWNLVFMQYNRLQDGTLEPLPMPAVDTGMGLERMSAVMQNVKNNFQIDTFVYLIDQLKNKVSDKLSDVAMQVIVDHMRAITFLILDQVYPSNEGRGYVLRRIMRRAMRFGYQGGIRQPFLNNLVEDVVYTLRDSYPELVEAQANTKKVVLREEEAFFKTLAQGCQLVENLFEQGQSISAEHAFKLYDTYGFPLDLLKDMAAERGTHVDEVGFKRFLEDQRKRSQAKGQFKDAQYQLSLDLATEFKGHASLNGQGNVIHILDENNQAVESVAKGKKAQVICDQTVFYPEGGGQVGDCGQMVSKDGLFIVEETFKLDQAIIHRGTVKDGVIMLQHQVEQIVSNDRTDTAKNHSATHLLHSALRATLGDHVVQRGSLVTKDRLRFDFAHFEALTPDQIDKIELLVNCWINENHLANSSWMALDEAKAAGVTALFDEKYDDKVRVLRFGDFSSELCGGTHVERTGDIGAFAITQQASAASGVRRLEAVTGLAAIRFYQNCRRVNHELSQILRVPIGDMCQKVSNIIKQNKENAKAQSGANDLSDVFSRRQTIAGTDVIYAPVAQGDVKAMRGVCDKLRELSQNAVILTHGNMSSGAFILCASGSLVGKIDLRLLMKHLNEVSGIELSGGGKPNMLQGKISLAQLDIRNEFVSKVKEQLEAL